MTRAWTVSAKSLALTCSLLLLAPGCASVGEPGSVATAWGEHSEPAKLLYVVGFNNGWKLAVISTSVASGETAESSEAARQQFARFDALAPRKLVALLDAFYADPRNQYVSLDFAMDLVIDKAAGVDIEPALGKAREIGVRNFRRSSSN